MTDALRRLLPTLVLLVLAAGPLALRAGEPACEEWAVAGVKLDPDSGIGGTGRSGGDGGIGGTGIYGTITGFGSICVNGLRVHVDDLTRVSRNQRDASLAELRAGQVVWVEAEARDGILRASSVHALSAVVGRIVAIDPASRLARVADRLVWIAPDATLVDDRGEPLAGFAALRPGDRVDVSGLARADSVIEATRVQLGDASLVPDYQAPLLEALLRDAELRYVSLEGHLDPSTGKGALSVAGLSVQIGAATLSQLPVGGRVYLLADVASGAAPRAMDLTAAPVPVMPPLPPSAPPALRPQPTPGEKSEMRVPGLPELLGPPASKPGPAPEETPGVKEPTHFEPRSVTPLPVPVVPPLPAPTPVPIEPAFDPVLDRALEPKVDSIRNR